jgi:hypothetical protein
MDSLDGYDAEGGCGGGEGDGRRCEKQGEQAERATPPGAPPLLTLAQESLRLRATTSHLLAQSYAPPKP